MHLVAFARDPAMTVYSGGPDRQSAAGGSPV
jgi:hypothetical protein